MDNTTTLAHLLARGYAEETVVISSDLKILLANQIFLQANALSTDQVTNKYCYEILKGCQESCRQSKRECPLHEIITTREPVSITHYDIEINEQTHHFKIDIYPIIPGHNEPISFLHITRDISSRVEEERFKERMWTEILGRMEKIYSSMVDNSNTIEQISTEKDFLIDTMPLTMVTWDREGIITKLNSSAEILFGWQAQQIIGKPFLNLFASGSSQKLFEKEIKAIVNGKSLAYALSENRTASGHVLFCEWYHSALIDKSSGNITGGLSLGQDVTERRIIQKELTDANKELTALLKSTEEAIIAVNHFNRIIFWNQATENLLGWLSHEAMGRQLNHFFPLEFIEQHNSLIESFLERDKPRPKDYFFEDNIKHRDGSVIPARIKLSPDQIDAKPILIAVIQDISARKKMELNFAETEKVRQLGELACGVAHDFNNLMTAIKSNSHLLKQQVSSAGLSSIQAIDQAVEIGAKKVASIQQMAGTGFNNAPTTQIQLTDLNQSLLEAIEFTQFRWKDQAEKDGSTVAISHDLAKIPQIPLESENIRDVFINLIFNAIDALPGSGKIHLQTSLHSETIKIKIEDNGHGIAKDILQDVFKPFFSTKKTGHSGLGLSSAMQTVSRHGGKIWAESNKGVGTAVNIELPLTVTAEIAPEKTPNKTHTKSLKVVVAEDDPLISSTLSNILQSQGHEVHTVSNGRKGVELIRQQKVDLLITDLGMPQMGGEEFISRLKKTAPQLPVLLITGWQDEHIFDRLRKAGISDLLVKPFDIEELLARVADIAT